MTMPHKSNFSKEKKKQRGENRQIEPKSAEKEKFKLPSKGILNAGRVTTQGLDYENQQDLER